MRSSIKISPPNSMLFVSDPGGGRPPYPVRDVLVLSTESCISVGCYPEQDGPTEVVLGNISDVDPGDHPAFDGMLDTPGRAIVVSTVVGETVMQMKVPDQRTRARIWVNHPRWPSKLIIGVG